VTEREADLFASLETERDDLRARLALAQRRIDRFNEDEARRVLTSPVTFEQYFARTAADDYQRSLYEMVGSYRAPVQRGVPGSATRVELSWSPLTPPPPPIRVNAPPVSSPVKTGIDRLVDAEAAIAAERDYARPDIADAVFKKLEF
jgi:hypothetical protein